METIKRAARRIAFGIAAFTSVMTASSASAFTVDPEIMNMINGIIVNMQQQTMNELYPQAPLQNQMRGKMMQEFSSKLILMNKIQPVMMNQVVNSTKMTLMESVVDRPIPLPGNP
ncbi:hypothetical protein GCAAIG_05595 [Candidatus Electronema halotolerans]